MSALNKILNEYSKLDRAEKRVAQAVQNNPEAVVKMTIKELSILGETSETTVFRFCHKLGYSGFSDFKIDLAMGLFDPEKELHSNIEKNDDTHLVTKKMLSSYIDSATRTIERNTVENFDEISQRIVEAQSLYFFGMGGSYSIADDARHKFVRFNQRSFAESDSHWQTILAATSTPNDVCFLFSNSGSNKDLLELIPYLKEKGIITVGFSSNESSSLAKETDYHLVAVEEGARFVTEAMESRQTTMLLIDILFIISSLSEMTDTEKNLHEIRQGIAKRRI